MATTRMTIGSVLGTVTSSANVITDTVGMVGDLVGMGTERIRYMADEQKTNLALDRAAMAQTALNRFSMNMATHMEEVNKFREGSISRSTFFDKAYAQGVAALQEINPKANVISQTET